MGAASGMRILSQDLAQDLGRASRDAGGSRRGRAPTASSNSHRLSSSTGSRIWSRRRGSTGTGITGCSPRITSSGPPSRRSLSGTVASCAMPRPVGMRSADMRHAEMPPATAATHATNRDLTTPPGSLGRNSWPGWGRSFLLRALGCGGVNRRAARDRHPQPLTAFHATVRTASEKGGFKAGLR